MAEKQTDGDCRAIRLEYRFDRLYDRCLQASSAFDQFLADAPKDSAARKPLERLRRFCGLSRMKAPASLLSPRD